MKKAKVFIRALLLLVCVFGAGSASAASAAATPCNTVDFYVYNGTGWLIDFEASNWTPGAALYTWYGYLSPSEEARFNLSAGSFELYASDALGGAWYLDKMVDLPACSRVAVYVKFVNGSPAFKLKIIPPG